MAAFGGGIEKYISSKQKLKIMAGDIPGWMLGHIRGRYIIKSTLSAPLWMRRSLLRPFRDEATALTIATGVEHVLDHDVPIDHPEVCGLTVPWNIVVVPHGVNAAKCNEWHPDQVPMFNDSRPRMCPFIPESGQGMFVIV